MGSSGPCLCKETVGLEGRKKALPNVGKKTEDIGKC